MRKRSTAPADVSRRQFLNTAAGAPVAAALWQNGTPQEVSVRKRSPEGAATQKKLLECLGGAWPDYGPLKPVIESTTQKDGYKLERVTYQVEPNERIAAYLLIPDGVTAQRRAPGICVWHQHNGAYPIGKTEPAGLAGATMHHTGVALAPRGYCVHCPEPARAGGGEKH